MKYDIIYRNLIDSHNVPYIPYGYIWWKENRVRIPSGTAAVCNRGYILQTKVSHWGIGKAWNVTAEKSGGCKSEDLHCWCHFLPQFLALGSGLCLLCNKHEDYHRHTAVAFFAAVFLFYAFPRCGGVILIQKTAEKKKGCKKMSQSKKWISIISVCAWK